jgi:hypothetical protein
MLVEQSLMRSLQSLCYVEHTLCSTMSTSALIAEPRLIEDLPQGACDPGHMRWRQAVRADHGAV